jgi:hypothetical protein
VMENRRTRHTRWPVNLGRLKSGDVRINPSLLVLINGAKHLVS